MQYLLLEDLKRYAKNNHEMENCVVVTRLKYDVDKPAEFDQLLGRAHNAIKKTDMALKPLKDRVVAVVEKPRRIWFRAKDITALRLTIIMLGMPTE